MKHIEFCGFFVSEQISKLEKAAAEAVLSGKVLEKYTDYHSAALDGFDYAISTPIGIIPLMLCKSPYITSDCQHEEAFYEASAYDQFGNEYNVEWDIISPNEPDESDACNWEIFCATIITLAPTDEDPCDNDENPFYHESAGEF